MSHTTFSYQVATISYKAVPLRPAHRQRFPVLRRVRKISRCQLVLPLHRFERIRDLRQQLVLGGFLTKHGGNLFTDVRHQQHMNAEGADAFHKLVNLGGKWVLTSWTGHV